MPFGVVSGVGRGIRDGYIILDGVEIVEGDGEVLAGKRGASNCDRWGLWRNYFLP